MALCLICHLKKRSVNEERSEILKNWLLSANSSIKLLKLSCKEQQYLGSYMFFFCIIFPFDYLQPYPVSGMYCINGEKQNREVFSLKKEQRIWDSHCFYHSIILSLTMSAISSSNSPTILLGSGILKH
jgi:hypothetical protein